MTTITLETAGLIAIKDNKLLLAYSKNKKAWYLPGGKIDIGETSLISLQREIQEELNITLKAERLKFYCHITAPAYGEKPSIIMEQDCFRYDLAEKIQASNEIGDTKYFSYEAYKSEAVQVTGVLKVFEKLIDDKLIQE